MVTAGRGHHAETFTRKEATLFALWLGKPHRATKEHDLVGRGRWRAVRPVSQADMPNTPTSSPELAHRLGAPSHWSQTGRPTPTITDPMADAATAP